MVAMPAGSIRMMMYDAIPEKFGTVFIFFIAGQFVAASEADELWNLRIRMQTGQDINAGCQGVQDRLMVE